MRKVFASASLLLVSLAALGQGGETARFSYGINAHYIFDNREFDVNGGEYMTSETIHAFRVAPSAGFRIEKRRLTQSLMVGADLLHNMGEGKVLSNEFTAWYKLEKRGACNSLSCTAGIFPSRFSDFRNNAPTAFISDSRRFYDSNIEGILLKYHDQYTSIEAGLDWIGLFGSVRRERFQIFAAGETVFNRNGLSGRFVFGWHASLYHFANSVEVRGVMDNCLVNPYLGYNRRWGWLKSAVKLGPLVGFHQDRINDSGLKVAKGILADTDISWRSFGIRNNLYFGDGQMPFYSDIDAGGYVYGEELYFGCPFFRADGFFDRAEFYWQPFVDSLVKIRLGSVLHFRKDGFNGWQQKLSILFDLQGKNGRKLNR